MSTLEATSRPVTEVAVGVILKSDGSCLLGQRPAGKPYAGYWEFPGGKLEKDESVSQALARELKEEIGIEILGSEPWQVIEHDYPHAYVRLNIHLVKKWTGDPRGLEGQSLAWVESPIKVEPKLQPLLPATIIILDLMKATLTL